MDNCHAKSLPKYAKIKHSVLGEAMRIFFLLFVLSSFLWGGKLPLLFSGNKAIASRDLYDAIGLNLPYALQFWEDQPVLDGNLTSQSITALSSYYRSQGYFETKITSETTDKKIIFTVVENSPIIISDIKINSLLDVEHLLTLHADDLFIQDKFSDSKLAIKKKYGDAGYCNATFNSKAWVDLETHLAHVLFEATPNEQCTFGPIHAESTPNIDGQLVSSMLYFDEGDPYSLEAISRSYETLYAQEAIARVTINDTDRNGSIVPISIDIEEVDKPIRFHAGLGYSSDEGIGVMAGIKHRNFFGNLKTLSFEGRYTELREEASGILSVPLGSRFYASGETGYLDEKFNGYRSMSVFEKLSLKHQDNPVSLSAALLFEQTKTYQSTNLEDFPETNLFIPSPVVELNIDTRNNPLNPTSGGWLNAKAQGSIYSSISDATYLKTLLMAAHLFSIDNQTIGIKAQWGMLRTYDGDVPSAYRFYAGGMYSNRAYSYRELGPQDANGDPKGFNSLLEGTLEYRFPIYEAIRGVVFTDLTYGSDNYLPDYNTPYWGVGTGLRYVTPIGPIAIDFGIDPNDTSQYAFHFRVGELF
jgi:translocation and assembly module TamA